MTTTETSEIWIECGFTVEGEVEHGMADEHDCPGYDTFCASFEITKLDVNGANVLDGIDMRAPEIVKLMAAIERAIAVDAEPALVLEATA